MDVAGHRPVLIRPNGYPGSIREHVHVGFIRLKRSRRLAVSLLIPVLVNAILATPAVLVVVQTIVPATIDCTVGPFVTVMVHGHATCKVSDEAGCCEPEGVDFVKTLTKHVLERLLALLKAKSSNSPQI